MKMINKVENLSIENKRFLPLIEEIKFKTTGDTSDDHVSKVCLEILGRKVDLANAHKRKGKNNLFENELFLANTIIHSIFASEYRIIVDNEIIAVEKFLKK